MLTNTITAIIPCRNRVSLLVRALESIYAQSYHVHEIIVIDDFSKFQIKNYIPGRLQERTVFIRNNEQKNAAFCRNQGIKISNGDILAFLDSDDYWHTEHIKLSLIEMGKQQVSFLFGKFYSIASDTKVATLPKNTPKNQFEIAKYLFIENGLIRTSTFVGSKTFIRSIMFDNHLEKHQDWDFIIRASLRSAIGFLDTPTAYLDESGTDRMGNTSNINASLYFISKHQKFFDKEITERACKRIIKDARNIPEFRAVITFYNTWKKNLSLGYFISTILHTSIIAILSPFPHIMKVIKRIKTHFRSFVHLKLPSS